jgi:hypothetical protein
MTIDNVQRDELGKIRRKAMSDAVAAKVAQPEREVR